MKDLMKFLVSNEFIKQLLFIILFLSIMCILILTWLRYYTNHGQKLDLPDFTNMEIEEAIVSASNQSFSIIVSDSTHIVGTKGGLILDQNPDPGSLVKENRKVYVTTTKYNPDNVKVKDLPLLYGTDYNQAVNDLKSRFIYSEVKSRRYDAGQPNHILEVWYKGKMIINKDIIRDNTNIEKGGKLSFVISEKSGGSFIVPDLTCRQYLDVKSYMLYSKLKLGTQKELGEIIDLNTSWIISQNPKANGILEMKAGQTIDITISSEKPTKCN